MDMSLHFLQKFSVYHAYMSIHESKINIHNFKYYLDRVRKNQRKILEDILSYFFGKYLPRFIGIQFF